MKKLFADFKKFISRGNVIDMAVGVAVASAFTAIVTAFTKGIINPLLALISPLSNQEDGLKTILREAETKLDEAGNLVVVKEEIALLWGPIIQAAINFFIVALVFFIILRIVATVREKGTKLRQGVVNMFTDSDEKAAAEAAAAAAAAEEAARLEAEAAEAAAAQEAAKIAEEERRKKNEEALLSEIRDLLRDMKK